MYKFDYSKKEIEEKWRPGIKALAKMFNVYIKDIQIKRNGTLISITEYDRDLVYFNIKEMPGCCGIAIIHDLEIDDDFEMSEATINKLYQIVIKMIQDMVKILGYGNMIYSTTDHIDNGKYKKVGLERNGWRRVNSSTNHNTGERIRLYVRNLNKKKKK